MVLTFLQTRHWVVPPQPTKIYTLTIDESKSDPAQMVSYGTDVDIVAGSNDWDTFFWYYPCLLNASWTETAKLNPNDYSKDINWASVNITSWDNVMVCFPRMWYKMSKSWNIITIQITDEQDAEWFSYQPFTRWTERKDKFYIWAYKWYVDSSKLRSWSGKSPTVNNTIWSFRTYAHNMGSWYEQSWYFQLLLRQIYFLFKYKNTHSQATLWYWYGLWSSAQSTWATNTSWLNYWNDSSTSRVKLFWVEDMWWNVWEWIDWLASNSSWDWAVNNSNFQDDWHWTWYHSIWTKTFSSRDYITKMAWDERWWLTPTQTWWSPSTYYTDCAFLSSGARVAMFGGAWADGAKLGLFYWHLYAPASFSNQDVSSRLMFL